MIELTRDEIESRAVLALSQLAMAAGIDLSADRTAGILISLRGSGVTIVQIETACGLLALCAKFDEKIRYGATLTAADIFGKIQEVTTTPQTGADPNRALLEREKRVTPIAELMPPAPEPAHRELPPSDR